MNSNKLESNSIQVKIENRDYKIGRFWCLVNPSLVRLKRAEQRIKDSLTGEWIKLNFNELGLNKIKSSLKSPSLFSPKINFLISEAEKLKLSDLKEIGKIVLADPHISVGFFLKSLPQNSSYRSFEALKVIELPVLQDELLTKWSIGAAKSLGIKRIDISNLVAIIRASKHDPDLIYESLEKLSLLTDESGSASLKACQLVTTHHNELDQFKILDIIAEGNIGEIGRFLKLLIDREGSPFGIIGLLFRSISQLEEVGFLLERHLNAKEIAQSINRPKWLVDKQIKQCRKLKKTAFVNEINLILATSQKLRSQSLSHFDLLFDLAIKIVPQK